MLSFFVGEFDVNQNDFPSQGPLVLSFLILLI